MNSPNETGSTFHIPRGALVFSTILLTMFLIVVGITGYFGLSSEASALSRSVMKASGGQWDKKIAVNVGYFSTGLIRFGSCFFRLPAEPRAALNSVRGAEVGIYKAHENMRATRCGDIFAAADKSMKSRGWDRIVGVAEEEQLVAVYMPHKGISVENTRCCVLVLHEQELVVASVRGNLEPLLQIATNHFDIHEVSKQFAAR